MTRHKWAHLRDFSLNFALSLVSCKTEFFSPKLPYAVAKTCLSEASYFLQQAIGKGVSWGKGLPQQSLPPLT